VTTRKRADRKWVQRGEIVIGNAVPGKKKAFLHYSATDTSPNILAVMT